MSESLRNDGRIWVPKKKEDAEAIRAGKLKPTQIKKKTATTIWSVVTLLSVTLVPRDVASRAAKERCDAGFGVVLPVWLFTSTLNRPLSVWDKNH
jgi:succinate dehydrogenase / fumarate reductase, flavoprotein subunit